MTWTKERTGEFSHPDYGKVVRGEEDGRLLWRIEPHGHPPLRAGFGPFETPSEAKVAAERPEDFVEDGGLG